MNKAIFEGWKKITELPGWLSPGPASQEIEEAAKLLEEQTWKEGQWICDDATASVVTVLMSDLACRRGDLLAAKEVLDRWAPDRRPRKHSMINPVQIRADVNWRLGNTAEAVHDLRQILEEEPRGFYSRTVLVFIADLVFQRLVQLPLEPTVSGILHQAALLHGGDETLASSLCEAAEPSAFLADLRTLFARGDAARWKEEEDDLISAVILEGETPEEALRRHRTFLQFPGFPNHVGGGPRPHPDEPKPSYRQLYRQVWSEGKWLRRHRESAIASVSLAAELLQEDKPEEALDLLNRWLDQPDIPPSEHRREADLLIHAHSILLHLSRDEEARAIRMRMPDEYCELAEMTASKPPSERKFTQWEFNQPLYPPAHGRNNEPPELRGAHGAVFVLYLLSSPDIQKATMVHALILDASAREVVHGRLLGSPFR
jgi:hypothetical protein